MNDRSNNFVVLEKRRKWDPYCPYREGNALTSNIGTNCKGPSNFA